MINYLSVEAVRVACYPVTLEYYLRKDDPIAPFKTANLALLDSALQQPQWDQYETLERKAAVLHYGLVKNHPFHNGNKRVAVVCMVTFLYINDLRLTADGDEVFEITKELADSDPKVRDQMLEKIEVWIRDHVESGIPETS